MKSLINLCFKYITMRKITTPSSYIKGYMLYEKGHVTIHSGGFVEVKSERYPKERPYILRFFGDGILNYEHTCGATAKNPDLLCKHAIASQFSKFPCLMVPPHEEIVNVFSYYRRSRIPSYIFDKDTDLYGVRVDLSDPELGEYLWVCLLARLMGRRLPRLKKSAVKDTYRNLVISGKYLTAKLKSLISSEDKENPIHRVLCECNGKSLGDIILENEEGAIENTKAIICRAFKEDLLLPKKLGKAYIKAYQQYSDLDLVL